MKCFNTNIAVCRQKENEEFTMRITQLIKNIADNQNIKHNEFQSD